MGRGRFNDRIDGDGLRKSIDKTAQEDTSLTIEERMECLEVSMKLLLLHAEIVTGEQFTEDDINIERG